MELTLVGLQYSGKTTFVNVIAVSYFHAFSLWKCVPQMADKSAATLISNLRGKKNLECVFLKTKPLILK